MSQGREANGVASRSSNDRVRSAEMPIDMDQDGDPEGSKPGERGSCHAYPDLLGAPRPNGLGLSCGVLEKDPFPNHMLGGTRVA
jgi:hypothetical protein